MGTIAEALVATAVGLIVAIPAVAVFNYFQGMVSATIADAETLGNVLLCHLKAIPLNRSTNRRSDMAPRPEEPYRERFPMPSSAE